MQLNVKTIRNTVDRTELVAVSRKMTSQLQLIKQTSKAEICLHYYAWLTSKNIELTKTIHIFKKQQQHQSLY